MKASIWWFLILSSLVGCVTDYRTDREVAEGIQLDTETIEVRKYNQQSHLDAFELEQKRMEEKMRMQRLLSCHRPHYLECWK